jgi:Tfp pilus assembly protein PilF
LALKKLTECEGSVPNRHQVLVLFMRGTALGGRKEWEEAIKTFRKAIHMPGCDNMGALWNNLGGAYSAKGDWGEASKAYSQALNTPGYDTPAIAWNNLGNAFASKGDLERSHESY